MELDFHTVSVAGERSFAGAIVPLFTSGCVLLRNFIDPGRLEKLQSLINAAYEQHKNILHIHPYHFVANGLMDFHEYLFDERHYELLTRIFDGDYSVDANTGSRRIDPDSALIEGGSWMSPLGVHLDACFHRFEFTVNFWVPFQPCGLERPSLGVVRASFDEVMEFCGFTGNPAVSQRVGEKVADWNKFHYFDKIISDLDDDSAEAVGSFHKRFADRVWVPTFAVGDAMMMTNWTFHFTHATAGMEQTRSNLELRFSSDKSLQCMRDFHSRGRAAL